ncbi:MAG TPA: hypothetical protein VMV18_15080 [bacterium]|nr:hypothetical protein [bacterium]
MDLRGDPEGIAALKALHEADKNYLKFLLQEAQSNFDRSAKFTAKDGSHWMVVVDPRGGHVEVKRAPTG